MSYNDKLYIGMHHVVIMIYLMIMYAVWVHLAYLDN